MSLATTSAPDASRESWLGVVGLGIGFLVIALAFALPAMLRQRPLDAQELLKSSFDYRGAPFEMEPGEVLALPLGERLVRLRKPGAIDSGLATELAGAPAPEPAAEPQPSSGGPMGPPFDWSKLPEGPADQEPSELVIVWYPRGMAEAIMRQQFWNIGMGGGGPGGPGGSGGPGGMRMDKLVLDSGELSWAGFGAPFVRERRLVTENQGTSVRRYFRETMRVNLSLGGQCCVLYAAWDENLPASRLRIGEVLERFRPKPATPGAAGD